MKPVVIFGTGELAQLAHVYLAADSPHRVAAFTVDSKHLNTGTLRGLEVVPFEDLERTHPPDAYAMFVAVGYRQVNRARAEVYHRCKARGYELISYVSSRAVLWDEAAIGDNCFIFENNVIQPFARIGSNVTIWSGSLIAHHAEIADHCFISLHAVVAGGARVGERSFIGANATIRDHVTVAPACVVGAGALILEDTQEEGIYPGVGSRPMSFPASQLRSL